MALRSTRAADAKSWAFMLIDPVGFIPVPENTSRCQGGGRVTAGLLLRLKETRVATDGEGDTLVQSLLFSSVYVTYKYS
eukprot:scaffold454_cov78-Skeletonema_marinoi.AAC.2